MTENNRFRSVLERAAKLLKIESPEIDALGTGGIKLEDGYEISLIAPPFDDFVYLAAPICFLDGRDERALCRAALESNYMLTETRGATLAIDPDTNQLILCTGLRLASLSPEVLAEEIASIDEVSQQLRAKFLDSAGVADRSDGQEPLLGGFRV